MNQKIAIACDHGGVAVKEELKKRFSSIDWLDLGTHGDESVDYPDYAQKMAKAIGDGEVEQGVLICGTGIGISIAANRHSHVRAALCSNSTMARLTREHNNANVICFGARVMGIEVIAESLNVFLATEFEGGRHEGRVNKMS